MTDLRTPARPDPHAPPPERRSRPGLFRAVWRWHFYASFLVIPVLLVLATTGLIYLFRFQLEPLIHHDLMFVEPAADTVAQPYDTQLVVAQREVPGGTAMSMTEPAAEDGSTVFSFAMADGSTRDVYVDPYSLQALGSLNPDTTLSGYAVRLHAELMAGRFGDTVIELAACWAIVMAISGYYLFARGWRARRRALKRDRPGARLRHRHGLIGAFVGVGLLFLLVSGLPWTGFWGAQAQQLASDRGSSLWSTDPGAISDPTSTLDESLPHSHQDQLPWAQQDEDVPTSEPPAPGEERNYATIDTAVLLADREGLRHPMTVTVPSEADGVFSVIGYAFDAPTDERTVHVDRFGGEAVSAYGFDDYPALAKVVSMGIGLHEGRALGDTNFVLSALVCVAVIASCVTGPLMWWRRRPRRATSIAAPRGRLPLRTTPLLAAAIVCLGVFLPFFGISLAVLLLLDHLVLRRVPGLAGWFDSTG
jgi:uncharacterized iron-regulated membrane protein